ncbi:MAG TPA: phosphatase PAP2-related protein, partial [Candidatus Methylomirabilis sp.]|nr:phosphatase PAP2-related protein [Candidatus Methylomirabilis sp.]
PTSGCTGPKGTVMTDGYEGSQGRSGQTLRRCIGFVLLAGAITACVYLLSREAGQGGSRLVRYALRASLVVCALVVWFWSQALIGSRSLKGAAMGDGIHELTAPLNRYLLHHPRAANATLIISSLFIDAFGIYLIAAGIFGPTLRPFVGLLLLFAFRQLCQALCALPEPKDMIWRYPGFPSLLVTYGTGNDFFISGHTAVAMLGAIELARTGPLWLAITAGVVAFLEGTTVIVLRAHYTMDVLAAACAAGCAAIAAGWLCTLL